MKVQTCVRVQRLQYHEEDQTANFFHEIYTHLQPPKCPDMTLHKKLNSGIIRRGIINNLEGGWYTGW